MQQIFLTELEACACEKRRTLDWRKKPPARILLGAAEIHSCQRGH